MAKELGIYRPRSPQKTPFYQCISDQFEEFERVYDERYERQYGFWRPIIVEVIEKFLDCGDLAHGFARVRCDHCGHEYLLAMLINEGKIASALTDTIKMWPHSGFNIHNEVEIDADDDKGKEILAQYIIKAPVSQERMIYDREKQKVIYKSKRGTVVYEAQHKIGSQPLRHISPIKALKMSSTTAITVISLAEFEKNQHTCQRV